MASSTPLCSVCGLRSSIEPSTIWCFECDEGLCSECKDHHNISKGTHKHCTMPIHEYQKKKWDILQINQTCAIHNEQYTMYCKTHESFCCGGCIVENHIGCRDFDQLADVIHNTKLSNAFYETEQSLVELSDNIRIIQNNRENNIKRILKKKMQIEQDIKQTRITINNHIDVIQEDFIKKLNATEVNESKIIKELLDLLKENERKITEYRTNIENIKQFATDLQTFIFMKEVEKKVSSKDKFLQTMINSEHFKERELFYYANAILQDLPNCISNFGEVNITTKQCDLVLRSLKDKQGQIILAHVLSESFSIPSLELFQNISTIGYYIRGCCLLPDGKMAFASDLGKAVRVFNFNGTKDFEVNTQTFAFNIAFISHDNTLAVTSDDSNTKCITIIDIQYKQIQKIIPVDSYNYHDYGIAVTDNKLICSTAGKGIQLINPYKNSIFDIVREEIPSCCYVATFGDTIYHTNNHSNTVTCFDLQGVVKWKFKNKSVLRFPCGISVDKDGKVYVVGNSSNNVIVISSDGHKYKKILQTRVDLSSPYSLDYNRSINQLLVSDFDTKAVTFTLI